MSLIGTGDDDYELTFRARETETEREKTARKTNFAYGTRVTGAGTLPQEDERLRVVAGSETVLTVEREVTTARLYRLPTPMHL